MLKKNASVAKMVVVLTLLIGAIPAPAQESTPKAAEVVQGHAYRLDYTVFELEDGKKLNSRQYSMNLNSDDQNDLKIGTRVPVSVKGDEWQYVDLGTSIWCRLRDRGNTHTSWLNDDVMLNTTMEISNFANPEQQSSRPVIRQLKIEASTIATLGKSITVGTVDDPNSRRQFQLDVTVTKLR